MYLSNGRSAQDLRTTECISGDGLAWKGDDAGTPIGAAQQELLDRYNVTNDPNGNPVVQRYAVGGGYYTVPVSGAVTVYYTTSPDATKANAMLAAYQDYINSVNYSGADPDDAQMVSADIAAANAAIQQASSTLASADLMSAAAALRKVRNDLPVIGHTTAKSTPTFYIYDWWNWTPHPIDRDAIQKEPRNTTCTNQKATMRRIAQAALSMNGMSGCPIS